jgi:hypothetical protein
MAAMIEQMARHHKAITTIIAFTGNDRDIFFVDFWKSVQNCLGYAQPGILHQNRADNP